MWFNLINVCNELISEKRKNKTKSEPNEPWTALSAAMMLMLMTMTMMVMKRRKGVNFVLINYDKWSDGKKEFHLLLVMCGVHSFVRSFVFFISFSFWDWKQKEQHQSIHFAIIKWSERILHYIRFECGHEQTDRRERVEKRASISRVWSRVINLYCGCNGIT